VNVKKAGPMKMDVVSSAFTSTMHGHEKNSISIIFSTPINKRLIGKDMKAGVPFRNICNFLKKYCGDAIF